MSLRNLGYDNENLDQIVCYFMRTVLHLQNSGVKTLPLENNLINPYKSFLDTAMKNFLDCQPPELCRLILEAEYAAVLTSQPISAEVALGLQVIKELAWHIYYDKDCYGYLLSTQNLWGSAAFEYAAVTFYPNLPEEIKREYHILDFMEHIPENML